MRLLNSDDDFKKLKETLPLFAVIQAYLIGEDKYSQINEIYNIIDSSEEYQKEFDSLYKKQDVLKFIEKITK